VLGAACIVGFIVGAVPFVTAIGNRVLVNRGGLFGAFIVGALLWRLGIWLIPFVGAGLFVLGAVWGIGGWVLGALATRRAEPIVPALLPASITAASEPPPAWEPPLAPGHRPPDHPTSSEAAAGESSRGPAASGGAADQRPDDAVAFSAVASQPGGGEADTGTADGSGDATAPDSLDERLRRFRAELDQTAPAVAAEEATGREAGSPSQDDRQGPPTEGLPERPDGGAGHDDGAQEGETPDQDEGPAPSDGWGLPSR
jgi:hypothetical protein